MAVRFNVLEDSYEDVPDIAAAFEALVDSFDKLLTLHAGDADVVGPLERVQALARRGSQLSRKLPR